MVPPTRSRIRLESRPCRFRFGEVRQGMRRPNHCIGGKGRLTASNCSGLCKQQGLDCKGLDGSRDGGETASTYVRRGSWGTAKTESPKGDCIKQDWLFGGGRNPALLPPGQARNWRPGEVEFALLNRPAEIACHLFTVKVP